MRSDEEDERKMHAQSNVSFQRHTCRNRNMGENHVFIEPSKRDARITTTLECRGEPQMPRSNTRQ